MVSNRPRWVLVAAGLYGISLMLRAFNETRIVESMAASGSMPAWQIGAGPFVYYLLQAFLLWNIVRLRNWARIALVILVIAELILVALFLTGVSAFYLDAAALSVTQLTLATVSAGLLLVSKQFDNKLEDIA